jgi:universal stress protein A
MKNASEEELHMDGYQNILLAADFSNAGENAAKLAVALASRFGASLTILHVLEHFPEDLPVSVIPPEDVDPEEFLTNRTRVELEKLSTRIGQQDATLEVVVSTHSARREIVKYAQGHGIDLIVVGSYGQDGIQGRTGSTANSVMRTANIDVLVVHPTE